MSKWGITAKEAEIAMTHLSNAHYREHTCIMNGIKFLNQKKTFTEWLQEFKK